MKQSAIFAITWTTYWIILPITLIASIIFRYNLLSCVYLLFLLVLPFSPQLSPDKISTWSAFSVALAIMSGLFLLTCVIFQIVLLAYSPYGSLVGEACSQAERIARYVGFERFDSIGVGDIFRLLLPDIIVFLVALLSYVFIRKTTNSMNALITSGSGRFNIRPKLSSVRLKNGLLLCLSMLFMALAGIAFPNIISFVYCFVFIILAMMWAFQYPMLTTAVAGLRASLTVLTVIQLLLLYVYQMQFMQTWLPPDDLSSRLLGFTAVILTDCDATYKLLMQPNVTWTKIVNPFCLFMLHWTLAVGVRMYYQDLQVMEHAKSRATSTANVLLRRIRDTDEKPLVQEEELPRNYESITRPPQSVSGDRVGEGQAQIQPAATKRKDSVLQEISQWFGNVQKYSFYVIALIVMMLWSVTYHSWLTFILLLWSCVLWMTKDRAKYTLYSSPAFVIYGTGLVLLQYVYALDLTEAELPTTIVQKSGNVLYLSEFGLRRFTDPCLHLGAQILYLCGFWLVLHQFNYYKYNSMEDQENRFTSLEPSFTEKAAAFIYEILCKYWVFLVIGFHLAVASEGSPTGIKIIYMAFLLLNIVTYSITWSFWRKSLTIYWTILVVYTMLVLVLIYTYQFKSFPGYWRSFTNFSNEQLADLGLKQTPNTGELLLNILIPALFLLAIILQLQYFNKNFLQFTETPVQVIQRAVGGSSRSIDPKIITRNEVTEAEGEENVERNWFSRKLNKWLPIVVTTWKEITSFLVRGLEFHLWRLVFITVFAAAVWQISALYGAFVLVWTLLLPFRKLHLPLFLISSFAASLIVLGIMFYQLQFIAPDVNLSYNCTIPFYGKNISKFDHLTNWIGVGKMEPADVFFFHVEGYIAIIFMIAFQRTVIRRQKWHRLWRNESAPLVTAFYPSITHKEMDDGLLNCTKFFVNYFFFKFGVQVCLVMTVITIWVHTDIFSLLYCIPLIIILTLNTRASLHKFWRVYVGVLIVLILWQYVSTLGMPPIWCLNHEYAWTTIGSNKTIRNRLVRWLHLPDYIVTINSIPSIADFFQLMFVVSQLFVFEIESSLTKYIGDNRFLTGSELDKITVLNNPKKNFMLKGSRTLLDLTKHFVFKYTIWITMSIIFFAGTSRISVFTLGYLICFFYLLSKQQELLMGKRSHLIRIFTGFLGYTVAVITLKAGLQIASCVYIDILANKACVFVQFMSLVCSEPVDYNVIDQSTDSCEISYDTSGLSWDFVCFLFLLIQLRIFASYYSLHVAEDLQSSMQLAARGAELFNDKLIAEVKEREKIQEENINAIKKSMKVIKEAYNSLRRNLALQKTHTDATRSGDYYMFDDIASRKYRSIPNEEKQDTIMDPIDMLFVADTIGIKEALDEREEDKKKLEVESKEEPIDSDEEEQENADETSKEELGSEENIAVVDGNVYIRLRKNLPALGSKEHISASQIEADVNVKESEYDHDHEDTDTDEDSEDEDENEKNMSFFDKLRQGLTFVWEFFMVCVDSLILFLNQQNKDYRNVYLQLSSEKAQLCEGNFKREAVSPRSTSSDVSIDIDDSAETSVPAMRKCVGTHEYVEVKAIDFDKDLNRPLKLLQAFWFIITARTDMVCYFLIILNLMLKASMIALVLPLAVLLWATLSTPRPSKVFWMFTIAYLEIVVVVKFIFQFEFFPWNSQASTNQHSNDPFWWPRFLGIDQTPSWSVMDLLQLLAVFFHVSVLKIHGLWDTAGVEDDNESGDEVLTIEDLPSSSQQPLVRDEDQATEENNRIFFEKLKQACQRPYLHYHSILNQRFSSVTDVYLSMFMCDVINFLIIIFGYHAFGQFASAQTDVVANLQTNNVPTAFLIMLLIQFIMMFIDRAIYLKKSMFGKMVFQIILVIGIHIWMFFILPHINQRPFYQNHVAQTWYFFKVLYFLLSAYQIRAGYPKNVTENFLTKSYGTVNLFLFKGYRAIPFLAEITAIMDWMYTGTSLGIGEWMKVWSIHAEVFELKCWRTFETAYPSPRGTAKILWIKYLVGGFLLLLLLVIVWFPLLLMNIALTIGGIANNPIEVDVKISIGSFEPIFQVVADTDDITMWNADLYSEFAKKHSENEVAASFLQRFSSNQVVSVNIDGESKTVWIISPPQRKLLADRLSPSSNFSSIRLLFEWTFTNDASSSSTPTSYGFHPVPLNRGDYARVLLHELLMGNPNVTNVTIANLFPQFLYSSGSSSVATPASSLYMGGQVDYLDVDFKIQSLQNDSETSWWSVDSLNATEYAGPHKPSPKINMVVFSDKVSPSSLSFLVNYGIIGLYVSVVLVVGRLVRSVFIGTTATIMFNELPYVDRILMLCQDLFLVREEGEFELEEDLYAKLIFLYRSPRLLIEWTRVPKTKTD